VVQRIQKPNWHLAGVPDLVREQVFDLAAERGCFALESDRWFDAAIVAAAERIFQARRSRPRRRWRRLARWFPVDALAPSGRGRAQDSSIYQADRARDSRQWERAARFYLDALWLDPGVPALWVQLGHALKAAGKGPEAQSAYRRAAELGGSSEADQK
jgi:tetratricopeptide (TPR) repeat protein